MFTFRLEQSLQFCIALILVVSTTVFAHGAGEEDKGFGNSKAGEHGAVCVRPGSEMRRIHMDLILHQRDKTVRKGMRDTTDSLKKCIACHVKYDAQHNPIPVNAEDQFCSHCHQEVAAQLDCFECHSTVPRKKTSALELNKANHIAYDLKLKQGNADLVQLISTLEQTQPQAEAK